MMVPINDLGDEVAVDEVVETKYGTAYLVYYPPVSGVRDESYYIAYPGGG